MRKLSLCADCPPPATALHHLSLIKKESQSDLEHNLDLSPSTLPNSCLTQCTLKEKKNVCYK